MKLVEKGFLKRNKKIILISLIIFLVFAVSGMLISHMMIGDDEGQITKALLNLPKNETNQDVDLDISSLDIFVHNLVANIIIIVGGLFFSIISVLIAAFNAVSIASPFGTDLTFSLVAILPHSIFEYTATVIALAAAFLITKLEIAMIKNRSFKGTLRDSKTELKDILVLVIVMVILLAIAAIIEGHITPIIVRSFFGL